MAWANHPDLTRKETGLVGPFFSSYQRVQQWIEETSDNWGRFWQLPGASRCDFLAGMLLIPAAVLWLRLFGFRSVQRILGKWRTGAGWNKAESAVEILKARSASRMMDAVSRHGLIPGNCLSRSVALSWLLHMRGIPAELRIGGKRAGGRFEAHAWVEVAGCPVNDEEGIGSQYSPFAGALSGEMAARK